MGASRMEKLMTQLNEEHIFFMLVARPQENFATFEKVLLENNQGLAAFSNPRAWVRISFLECMH